MWISYTPVAVTPAETGDPAKYHDDVKQTVGIDEADEQRVALLAAAAELAKVVGLPDERVQVTISGHANPEHSAGGAGIAYEMVTITVHAVATPD
jgi:hypothetical protein